MRKLKAGALQLTLFICVVIALVLAAFVILIQTHRKFNLLADQTIEVVKNADKGIQYALSNTLSLNDSISIKLEADSEDLVKVHRSYWGLFEKVSAKSTLRTKAFNKIALVGGMQPKTDRTALYVQDNNKPLVLVGNTRIQGTTYLSERGVKPGNIAGQSYYGGQLIDGQIKRSTDFPKLSNEVLNELGSLSNTNNIGAEQFLDISRNRQHQNSFNQTVQYVVSSPSITLSNISLVGHIAVLSNTKIVVDATAKLKDVLLIAPRIEIRDNVAGTFQAMASKEIIVGKNCQLQYPSALLVKEAKSTSTNMPVSKQIAITVGDNSEVHGALVYVGQERPNNTQTQVVIEDNALVKGQVYCNQNLELKGTVDGAVFTANFMANQFGSIYQNHIYNGTIEINNLPQEYVGLSFDSKKKGVMKWLY